jgi:hypothetical protein
MPKAEKEEDLKAEGEIVAVVLSMYPDRYDGHMKIDGLGYRLDGVLTKKHDYGYAVPQLFYECKNLKQGFKQYPDYFISHSKVAEGMRLTQMTQMRSVIFARFAEGIIASCDMARFKGKCRFGAKQMFVHDDETLAIFQWDDFVILHDPGGG